MALPTLLYSATQVRALDAHAIDTLGIAGYTLMKRAGEAALRYLRTRWPMAHRIVIVCGPGNNGGDGYVLARFAQAAGLTVSVLSVTPVGALRGDARQACDDYRASGAPVHPFDAALLGSGEVIVDALLGTGIRGGATEQVAAAIRAINVSGVPVFSLDVPSGLDADTGEAPGEAVRADATVTFAGLKTGLFVGDGPEFAGQVFFDDLELTETQPVAFAPALTRIVEAEIHEALPQRARAANKGDFGRVLIVGSGAGMPGGSRARPACAPAPVWSRWRWPRRTWLPLPPAGRSSSVSGSPTTRCSTRRCSAPTSSPSAPGSAAPSGRGVRSPRCSAAARSSWSMPTHST
jgi:ADP-dependent NAD(P)H-hydrate dehydratase / NAD(P)H-hydrate epimerase